MFDLFVLILVLIRLIFPFCRICIKSTTLFCLQCIVYYMLHAALPPSFYFLIMLSKGGRLEAGRGLH